MKAKILILSMAAVVAVAGVGTAGHDWWERNRMSLPCLLGGFWDGGPGEEFRLGYWDGRPPTSDEPHRELVLIRHWPQSPASCAPEDKDAHWAFVEKIADERNWAEANFLLAVKLGYGDVYGEVLFDSDNSEILRPDLGDGTDLDLQQSFALLQKAAEQGYFRAQMVLDAAHQSGEWGKDGGLKISASEDQVLITTKGGRQ